MPGKARKRGATRRAKNAKRRRDYFQHTEPKDGEPLPPDPPAASSELNSSGLHAETGGKGTGAARGRGTREEPQREGASALRRRVDAERQRLEEALEGMHDTGANTRAHTREITRKIMRDRFRAATAETTRATGSERPARKAAKRTATGLHEDGLFTKKRAKELLEKTRGVLAGEISARREEARVLMRDDMRPGFAQHSKDAVATLLAGKVEGYAIEQLTATMGEIEIKWFEHDNPVHEYTDYHLAAVKPKLIQASAPQRDWVPSHTWTERSDSDNAAILKDVQKGIREGALEVVGTVQELTDSSEVNVLSNVFVISKMKEDGTRKERMAFADIYNGLFVLRGLPCDIDVIEEILDHAPRNARGATVDGAAFFHSFALAPETSKRICFAFKDGGTWKVARARAMLFGEAWGPCVAQGMTGAIARLLRYHGIAAAAIIDDIGAVPTQRYIDKCESEEAAYANVAFLLLQIPALFGVTNAEDKSNEIPKRVQGFLGLIIDFERRKCCSTRQKLKETVKEGRAICESAVANEDGQRTVALGRLERWTSKAMAQRLSVPGVRMFLASALDASATCLEVGTMTLEPTEGAAPGGSAGEPKPFISTGEKARKKKARAAWRAPMSDEMEGDMQMLVQIFEDEIEYAEVHGKSKGMPFPRERHMQVDLKPTLHMDTDASMPGYVAIIYAPGQKPIRTEVYPQQHDPGMIIHRADGRAWFILAGEIRQLVTEEEAQQLLIRQGEAITVLHALREAIKIPEFVVAATGARIVSGQDNQNWIFMFLKGGGRHPFMRSVAKQIWAIVRDLGSTFEMRYVKSALNPADDGTRHPSWGEATLDQSIFNERVAPWASQRNGGQKLTIDACATQRSAKIRKYIARFADSAAELGKNNVMSQDLQGEFAYIFPPAVLAEQVWKHAEQCGGPFVMICQQWPSSGDFIGKKAKSSRWLWEKVRRAGEGNVKQITQKGEDCVTIPSQDQGAWKRAAPRWELVAIYVPARVTSREAGGEARGTQGIICSPRSSPLQHPGVDSIL